MTGFGRVPAPVGAAEYRTVGAGGILTPDAQSKDLSKAAGKSRLTTARIPDQE